MNATRKRPPSGEPAGFWRRPHWIWILLVAGFWALWLSSLSGPEVERLSYSAFKKAVREGRVAEVTLEGERVEGTFRESGGSGVEAERRPKGAGTGDSENAAKRFRTTLPPIDDPGLLELLERGEVTVGAEAAGRTWWAEALVMLLPWLLILGLLFWASARMQQRMVGGGHGPFGFARSRARHVRKGTTGVTFADVAGAENAKRDLEEIVHYLRDPARYAALGAKIPKGVLLMGAPGTGKTLLARAVAGEADVPFYSIGASEFIEMFVGVGAARVRDMFQAARAEAPAIIFIDELDAIGRTRGAGVGGGHDEREQTLNQILSEMDGFAPHESVVVIAATNRPDVLDPALLRPGRFDRKVTLELPRREARREILRVHVRGVPLADDVDLDRVARRTADFSGADLENLVNEAALLAGREGRRAVDAAALERARDKIVLGAEREGVVEEEERRRVACHEAGHALVACLVPDADPLDKVTIIARGHALGATQQMPEEERHNVTRSYLLDRIAILLAGRAAEQVVFGEVTSGSEQDLKQATELARRMVCRWGMSERIGAVSLRRGEEHPFLGREIAQPSDFGERTAELVDEEIRRLTAEMAARAEEMVTANREALDRIVEALVERETLDSAEVRELLFENEQRVPRRRRRVAAP